MFGGIGSVNPVEISDFAEKKVNSLAMSLPVELHCIAVSFVALISRSEPDLETLVPAHLEDGRVQSLGRLIVSKSNDGAVFCGYPGGGLSGSYEGKS